MENAGFDLIRDSVLAPNAGTTGSRHSPLIEAIWSRRSVSPKRLIDPGPSRTEIELIVQSALTAPDHGNLRPWRAVVIPQSRREKLAALFMAAKQEEKPGATQEDLERAGQKALNGPLLMAMLLNPVKDHPEITIEEQYIALGAAIQNMLLTAHGLGYGAMTTSGRKMRSRALRGAFVRAPHEKLVAFVTVGTRAHRSEARPSPPVKPYVSEWELHSDEPADWLVRSEEKQQTSGCP